MTLDRRDDGELKLHVLIGYEMAAGEGGEVALRLEFAKVQEQLTGHAPPAAEQLVMTADAAEAMGMQLVAVAAGARATLRTYERLGYRPPR